MEILSVLIAAFVSFALGAVYYMALSKPWMAAAGKTEAEVNEGDKTPFVIAGLAMLLSAGMMRHILAMAGVASMGKGAMVGAGIGLFMVGAWIFLNNGYEGKPIKLSVINTGYAVLALAVQGIVLTVL